MLALPLAWRLVLMTPVCLLLGLPGFELALWTSTQTNPK